MRLRLLFTLGFVLLLSTFASSNECRRYCGHLTAVKAATAEKPATPAPAQNEEYSMLLSSKLLYI